MNLAARLRRLEQGQDTGVPEACVVHEDGTVTVYLYATGERLPLDEYQRRWPDHPVLKCYLSWRLPEAV